MIFTDIRNLMASVAAEANSGTVPKKQTLDLARKYLTKSEDSCRHLIPLSERASALKSKVSVDRTDFYQGHVLTQIAIHRHGSAVLRAMCKAILELGQKKVSSNWI